jgi:NADP-dependent 3-hydroxy acid dehydrogenase YdfG
MQTPEVVVITGASAGVGRATARAFGKRGEKIGLIARGRDGLEEAKREIEELGGEAIVLPLDVADENAVEQAAAEVERTFGAIDIWINNAMLSVFSPIMEMTPSDYRRVTGSRCSRRTAQPNMRCRVFTIRCAAS